MRTYLPVVAVLLVAGCKTPAPEGPPAGAVQKAGGGGTEPSGEPRSRRNYLKVHIVNVRQGDGIVVECPDGEVGMIVDAGDSRDGQAEAHFEEYIRGLMEHDQDKTVPLVVATHPHSDHIGRLAWVLQNFTVTTYVDNGQDADSRVFRALKAAIKASQEQKHTSYIRVTSTPDFPWTVCPGVAVRAIVPASGFSGCKTDPNRCSLLLRIDHEATSFLFTGDAEHKEEEKLLADEETKKLLEVDVLKAGHHGSNTSSTQGFLDAVKPKCVLVSAGVEGVGTNAGYKHPRATTMRRFSDMVRQAVPNMGWRTSTARAYDDEADPPSWIDLKIRTGVALTPLDGDIVARSDGSTVWCRTGAPPYATR